VAVTATPGCTVSVRFKYSGVAYCLMAVQKKKTQHGSWLEVFAVLYLVKLLVNWMFNVVYEHLVNVYGPWKLRVVMGYIRSNSLKITGEKIEGITPQSPTYLPIANLGRTERIILRYLASSGLVHQFRIANIVHGTGLSTKVVYSALHRMMSRGFVEKKSRGVYKLTDQVIKLLNNGYIPPKPEENKSGDSR